MTVSWTWTANKSDWRTNKKGGAATGRGLLVSRRHCPSGAGFRGLPGWSSVRTPCLHCRGHESNSWSGISDLHAEWGSQKKKAAALLHHASLVPQTVMNLPTVQETLVRSLVWEDPPGGGNGNLLQYSSLENSLGRGAWWATVHGVTKSQTRLIN